MTDTERTIAFERDTDGRHAPIHAKTSASAVLALVFGLAALFSVLIAVLAPLGVLFGLLGLIFGVIGRKRSKNPHVTGGAVAVIGIVMSVLGLIVGIALTASLVTFLTDPQNMQEIRDRLEDLSTLR
jgi:predicted membrane protein